VASSTVSDPAKQGDVGAVVDDPEGELPEGQVRSLLSQKVPEGQQYPLPQSIGASTGHPSVNLTLSFPFEEELVLSG
jgi:hypothetical protein